MLTRTLITLMTTVIVLLGLELGFGVDLGLQKAIEHERAVVEDELSFAN